MIRLCKNRGFSLTEVLLSVGILSVGMIFIAGVFPAAIHFTTIATERTIAAIAADEAFAKIRLYAKDNPVGGIDFGFGGVELNHLNDFNDVLEIGVEIDPCEFAYPSTGADITQKQYFWSALCRRVGPDPNRLVQVTVFVCRKVSPNLEYPDPDLIGTVDRPMPVKVGVEDAGPDNELRIRSRLGAYGNKTFINDGYTIVDDRTSRIYRVLERYRDDPDTAKREDEKILLDRDWDKDSPDPEAVWVVPPPVNGGRYPCIAVYQKEIRF